MTEKTNIFLLFEINKNTVNVTCLGYLSFAQRCRNIEFLCQEVFGAITNSCCWARLGMERYLRSSTNFRGPSNSVAVILTVLLTLIVLGELLFCKNFYCLH